MATDGATEFFWRRIFVRNPCGLNLLSDWSISRLTQSSGREIEAKNVEIRSVTSRAEQRQYLPVGGGECNFFFSPAPELAAGRTENGN